LDPKQTAAGLVDVGDRIDVIANQKSDGDQAETPSNSTRCIVGATEYTAGRTIARI
jgi:hypothetical protein